MALPYVIVFDLDDTLYLERQFVLSGYQAAGVWLERTTGVTGLEERCLALFESGRRTRVFDVALEALELGDVGDLVVQLVDVYRSHKPKIALAGDADRYLRRRSSAGCYALITDGIAATQLAKVQALGLERQIERVIFTGAWGHGFGKPHPRAFETIEAWSGRSGADLVYVADNPTKDFVTPRARGWWTVQILRPERVHHLEAPDPAHEAHAVVSSLDELDDRLADLYAASTVMSAKRRAGD